MWVYSPLHGKEVYRPHQATIAAVRRDALPVRSSPVDEWEADEDFEVFRRARGELMRISQKTGHDVARTAPQSDHPVYNGPPG